LANYIILYPFFCISNSHTKKHKNTRKFVATGTRNQAVTGVGPTLLVVTDFEGHPRSMMSSEKEYATSYW